MTDSSFFRKYSDIITEISAREQDMRRRMDALKNQASAQQTQTSSYSGTDVRTPNARGANIAPPVQGFAGTTQTQPIQANQTGGTTVPAATSITPVNNQSSGYSAQSQAQKSPEPASNVDNAATRARDRLQQNMASGKVATPAPNVVNPNQQYGGGYDPSKVQYASGGNTPQGPTASATQSASSDQAKLAAIGGQTGSAAQSTASDQSKLAAVSGGAPATTTPQTASTGGGFQGGNYGSVGTQTAAPAPATQTSTAPDTSTAAGAMANMGRQAEVTEEDEVLEAIKRLIRK